MVTVRFIEAEETVRVPAGTTLLEAAREAGVLLESPCDGALTCGKCRVRVGPEEVERLRCDGVHHLPEGERSLGWVLACGAFLEGDVTVSIPHRSEGELRIVQEGFAAETNLDPAVVKTYDPDTRTTAVRIGGREAGKEEGDTRERLFGAVVDIGTTTLVAALVDLRQGTELGAASALNPQALHAQDVLGRIRIGSEPEGLGRMQALVAGEIARLLTGLAREHRVAPEEIYEVVYSGNTAMLHLAAGLDPASLGRHPYRSALAAGHHRPAAECRLTVSPLARVYFPPAVSAFVGADITAGLLAAGLDGSGPTTLFVDIGTNGEMVLSHEGRLFAASTAAGPAFEGMNVTCGMRAGRGAVERCTIGEDGSLSFKTIGRAPAVGLCGSGLIDLVGELVRHGIIGPRGNLARTLPEKLAPLRPHLIERNGKPAFVLTDRVFLTGSDIRQVQLAKAAIRAGIELLLRHAGIAAARLERVLIAGSFGAHLHPESLLGLGMLPPECSGRIVFLGNTAKSGGKVLLLDSSTRGELDARAARTEAVDLASYPDFERVFVRNVGF